MFNFHCYRNVVEKKQRWHEIDILCNVKENEKKWVHDFVTIITKALNVIYKH